MDVCEVYRIPHSEFLAWDPDDRHKAIMHQLRKAERCPSCHVHPDETDPRAGGRPDAFEFEFYACPTCKIRSDGEKELKRTQDDPAYHVAEGTTVRLRRRRTPIAGGDAGG